MKRRRGNETMSAALTLLLFTHIIASSAEVSVSQTLPGPGSQERIKITDQLRSAQITRNARRNRQVAAASPVGLLMDDPPPFPLDEFARHDLVAPISRNGAHLGGGGDVLDATDSQRERSGLDGAEEHQEEEADVAFLGSLETNVTASLGQSAFLRCRLRNAQQQVTWVRIRDWHILTSGLLTYTADARFRVKHAADAFEWTLEIKYLQKRDEGTYYCQIPTRTGTAVHAFHLHVASPQAVILGGHVSHVDIHTPSLTLVCIVDNTPDPPQVIFWYHNGTLLTDGKYPETSASAPTGGAGGALSPSSETGLISSHLTLTATRTMSMLTLQHIQHIHSGNYTCQAPNAEPDTAQLFVTQRHEAAVHRSSFAPRNRSPPSAVWLLALASLIGHVGVVRRRVASSVDAWQRWRR